MLRDRLKGVLKQKKVSGYRLWKELKVNQGQLSRFLNGKGSISLKNLERIARYLGCEITILGGDERVSASPGKKETKREDRGKGKDASEEARNVEGRIAEIVTAFEDEYQVIVKGIDAIGGRVKLSYGGGTVGLPQPKPTR